MKEYNYLDNTTPLKWAHECYKSYQLQMIFLSINIHQYQYGFSTHIKSRFGPIEDLWIQVYYTKWRKILSNNQR